MTATPDYQRLPPMVTSQQADVNGNAQFKFPTVPATRERWGNLTCPKAPATALFTLAFLSGELVSLLGTEEGTWSGPNTWGPIICASMLTPVVFGSGLVAGTNYSMAWWGYEGAGGIAELVDGPIYPAPSAAQPLVA